MRSWIIAVAAGAMLSAGVADAQAQGNSQRARQEQRARQDARERERAREDARERERERERLRAQRDAEARRTSATRDARNSPVYGTRPRNDDPWFGSTDPRRQQGGWEIWDRDRRDRRQGNGPPFCRAGRGGHPVFGYEWCRDKGFGNSRDRDFWGDIILRPRDRRNDSLGRTVLRDVLGSVVFGRLDTHSRRYGSGLTTGQWMSDGNALVLQLFSGRTPVARLYDHNRDGRVDRIMLRQ